MRVVRRLISWAIPVGFLALALVSFFVTLHLLRFSTATRQLRGGDFTPEMLVLSNQKRVAVGVRVNYYTRDYPSDIGLAYGSQSVSLPTGVRAIELNFSGGVPGSTLLYTVLLGKDATETSVVSQQAQQQKRPFYVGRPRGTFSNTCAVQESAIIEQALSGMNVSQYLYGLVPLDSHGDGAVNTAGRLVNQRAYLTAGDNVIVNVMNIISIAPTPASTASSQCALTFPGWANLAGLPWYPPRGLSGQIRVGAVGADYTVASANPALADLATLSWQIDGPTAINYTLINETLAQRQSSALFWAGVLAALATALGVDGVKGMMDNFAGSSTDETAGPVYVYTGFITAFFFAAAGTVAIRIVRWLLRRND